MLRNAKQLIALGLMLAPFSLSAQEGTIQFDRVVKIELDARQLPDRFRELIPEQGVTPMLLHFTSAVSLMVPATEEEQAEEEAPERGARGARGGDRTSPAAFLQRIRASSTQRSDSRHSE